MATKRTGKKQARRTVAARKTGPRRKMAAQHADHYTREADRDLRQEQANVQKFESKRGKQALPYGMDERMEFRQHIEREDGVLRDPVRWNGTVASFVKEISRGENGYDPERQMVLLQTIDGATHVVPFSDISKTKRPPVVEYQVADRVPNASNVPYKPERIRV